MGYSYFVVMGMMALAADCTGAPRRMAVDASSARRRQTISTR